jgi:hypothetical protein
LGEYVAAKLLLPSCCCSLTDCCNLQAASAAKAAHGTADRAAARLQAASKLSLTLPACRSPPWLPAVVALPLTIPGSPGSEQEEGGEGEGEGSPTDCLGSGGLNKSRYRGVSYDRKKAKWRVQIKVGLGPAHAVQNGVLAAVHCVHCLVETKGLWHRAFQQRHYG